MSRTVLRLFADICSYTKSLETTVRGCLSAYAGSELHLRHLGRTLFGLEELALGEVEHSRDDHRRERLDLRVVLLDAVVVELARVRDPVLGRRQFLLQAQEVLIRLEVGVALGEREQ